MLTESALLLVMWRRLLSMGEFVSLIGTEVLLCTCVVVCCVNMSDLSRSPSVSWPSLRMLP